MKLKTSAIISIFLLLLLTVPLHAQGEQEFKVALVSDIGGFEDGNYNQQLRDSLNNIDNEINLNLEFKESELMTDYLDNLTHFAENEFDLIWGVGFTMKQAVKEAAQMYNERKFVIFDAVVKEDNVLSIDFAKKEEGFLAGVIAGLESNNSKVAFIGGKENQELKEYEIGFRTGAEAVSSNVEIVSNYIGSFNDYSAAEELTKKIAEQNVDIVFYAAGPASQGIIKTAINEDLKLISLKASDIKLAPKNMITAVLKNTDFIVSKTVDELVNDNYISEVKEYGLADNAFVIDQKQAEEMMSQENLEKIEEYKQRLISGDIEF